MSLLSLLLVLAALIVVYSFLIPGMRPKDGRFKSGRRPVGSIADIARMGSADGAGAWVAPMVGGLALASIYQPGVGGAGTAGATLGAICGLTTVSAAATSMRNVGLSVLGLAAAAVTVATYLGGSGCSHPVAVRAVVLVLTMVAFAIGLLVALIRGAVPATVGLEAFALIEIVAFMASPLRVDLTPGPQVFSLFLTVVLGVACGFAPRPMFSLVGVGAAIVALWASTVTFDGCGLNGSGVQLTVMLCGAATYFITSALMSFVRR